MTEGQTTVHMSSEQFLAYLDMAAAVRTLGLALGCPGEAGPVLDAVKRLMEHDAEVTKANRAFGLASVVCDP